MYNYIYAVLLIAVTLNAQSRMFRGNIFHTGVTHTEPLSSSPERKFTFAANGAVRSTPAIDSSQIYFGCADGYLYAVDKLNGKLCWKFKTGGSISSSPAISDGMIIFSSRDGFIYAVNKKSGKLIWKFKTGKLLALHWGFDIYLSSPLIVQDNIYIGSGDGCLYKISLDGKLIWKYKTEFRIRSTPAYSNGIVYFGDCDGTFYAVNSATGKLTWNYDTEGKNFNPSEYGTDRKAIISSPAVSGGKIIFGARDGFLYVLDEKTGELIWKKDYDISWVIGSPAVADNKIYVGTSDGRFFHCLNMDYGNEIWKLNTGTVIWTSAVIVKNIVYFCDSNGNIFAVNKESGKIDFKYTVNSKIYSSPVVENSILYVGSDDGNLYAINGSPEEKNIKINKAFYYDANEPNYYFKEEAMLTLKNYFLQAGYKMLDTGELRKFFMTAVDSNLYSTIIFLTTLFPDNILDYSQSTDKLREYLTSGNNIVMLTRNPLGLVYNRDRDSLYEINFDRSKKILDLNYAGPSYVEAMGGFYQSYPTSLGLKIGMAKPFISSFGVDKDQVDKVLAEDEYGKATSWIKSFTGNKNLGYIQLWLPNTGIGDPSFIINAAEYGFFHQ